ncbi:MAG: glycosyltransferase family 4 protein [Actinomycetota bacterium]|nr:glycosyltransferase family 4 protein [Actinomycetota bacterium]
MERIENADPTGGGGAERRALIVVFSQRGEPSCEELERSSISGAQPRKDYVLLAQAIDAEVLDSHYMAERASLVARGIGRCAGIAAGQTVEAFIRQRRFRQLVTWSEGVGFVLALLFKATRGRRDMVMIAISLTTPKKAFFLHQLKVYTHIRAIVTRRLQIDAAVSTLGVPREKLHFVPRGVDEQFWHPDPHPTPDRICAVGWEARDYGTLFDAVDGASVEVELALGSIAGGGGSLNPPLPPSADPALIMENLMRQVTGRELPANVTLSQHDPKGLRELYSKSHCVVVPIEDVPFDAGVTALTEAMAMGKAVIATRTAGLSDLFEDGVQGILVQPCDPREMRTAIERLVADPDEARRMGAAGRALVEREHRMDLYVDRLAAVVS